MESEVEKLVPLGCLGALELVPLGHVGTLGTLDGCCFLGVLVAHRICWEPPIVECDSTLFVLELW